MAAIVLTSEAPRRSGDGVRAGVESISFASDLSVGPRRCLQAGAVTAAFLLIVFAAHVITDVGGETMDVFLHEWLFLALPVAGAVGVAARAVLVREERLAWSLLASGLALYAIGTIIWTTYLEKLSAPPIPSVSDALWLSLFPCAYATMIVLVRGQMPRFAPSVWFDGLISGLAVAALAVAVLFEPAFANATGSFAAVATNFVFPVADVVMIALLVGVYALSGWRPGLRWGVLGLGFLLFFSGDALYSNQVAAGTYVAGEAANLLWALATTTLAAAAWLRPREMVLRLGGFAVLAVPAGAVVLAIGLLFYDHFVELSLLAIGLCGATLIVGLLRTAMTFREAQALGDSRVQAFTDDLTGLPNRRHFDQELAVRLQAATDAGLPLAVLLIDLDRFKELNDTLGHHAGDLLLELIGPRLRGVIGRGDTVARLGGDEFAVLLEVGADAAQAVAAGQRVLTAIRRVFPVESVRVRVDASVGIAVYPQHASNADDLLRRADVAMYKTKAADLGPLLYCSDNDEQSRDRLALVSELRHAIDERELVAHYQPKADGRTGAIVGLEALVRWPHPVHGLLMPDRFLPLAEQTLLMRDLTLLMLDHALEHWHVLQRAGFVLPVAVNLAAASIIDEQLPGDIADRLARWQVAPDQLVLEISEDTAMVDPIRAMDVLARLGELGVSLSLDDFGTGYSSLAYLKRLPIQELKIDRSFVMRMTDDRDDAAIVRHTVELAHSLHLRIVAEGVESPEAWAQLRELGCDVVQGYVLSRPLAPQDLVAWLRSWTVPKLPLPSTTNR